jgi:ABC-type multidrug transport system fused ATPase/permease subunit
MTSTSSAPASEFYQQRAKQFQLESERIEKRIRVFSWSRVVLVALIGLLIYFGLTESLFLWLLIPPIGIFIMLVRKQTELSEKKQRSLFLKQLNENEAKAIKFEATDFSDGSRFSDPHHPYSHDLDLFGPGSVFQYLNRCATQLGEEKLAYDLKKLSYSAEALLKREEAVRELGSMIEFRQQVWAVGRQINDYSFDRATLLKWLTEKPFIYKNILYTWLRWLLPAITLCMAGFTYYDGKYFPLLFTMMIIQLAIAGFQAKRIGEFQRVLSVSGEAMKNYARIFEWLAAQKVNSVLMRQYHHTAQAAFEKVKHFSALVNALESRMNPLAMQLGNGLFLYDFHIVSKLEKWREENAKDLPHWLDSMAEWDSLLSLATLHFNYPHYAFAEVNVKPELEGVDVGHILIPGNIRVANNFNIGKPANVYLITGANMAGKSTFLRALGVNFALGRIGSPVCASRWSTPLIDLHTGMRTTDSLQDHQSYFFAELNRLQVIMQELNSGKPMFILLDEILKGTNSTDKQLGSRELLKQLKDKSSLVVLATHDIALGALEEQFPNQIANACFEGKIENDQLTFDYTLKQGVAQKANATFLMRKMGIIPPEL